jgi:hypothetical protein
MMLKNIPLCISLICTFGYANLSDNVPTALSILIGPDERIEQDKYFLFSASDGRLIHHRGEVLPVDFADGKGIITKDLSSVTLADAKERWGKPDAGEKIDGGYKFKIFAASASDTAITEPVDLYARFENGTLSAYKIGRLNSDRINNDRLNNDSWTSVSAFGDWQRDNDVGMDKQWQEWHKTVTAEVWRKFAELSAQRLSTKQPIAIQIDYDVLNDGTIIILQVRKSIQDDACEQCSLDAVNSVAHSPLLKFPEGSRRARVQKCVTLHFPIPEPSKDSDGKSEMQPRF